MTLFQTNRDLDSTIIVIGVHVLLFTILALHAFELLPEGSTIETNAVIIYGMIVSYFFKSKTQEAEMKPTPQKKESA